MKKKYAPVAYDGASGLASAGRWHCARERACYASEHPALAALDKLVWTDDDAVHAGIEFVLVPLTLRPKRHLDHVGEDEVPSDWDAPDHAEAGTRAYRTEWLAEGTVPVLSVPSVLLPMVHNFLVNPLAPTFEELQIGEAVLLEWDPRLFGLSPG